MSQTILSYLKKVRSGLIFSDSFENDAFLTAEGWTKVQGQPKNSTDHYMGDSVPSQSDGGIKSFKCLGTGSSLAIVSKTLPSPSLWVTVWFYDDLNTAINAGPFFKARLSNGTSWLQVGARNDVSTSHYSANDASTATENNFSATGIARTLGWHRLDFVANAPGGSVSNYYIRIDGNVAVHALFGSGLSLDKIFLCSGKVGDTLGTFGFFDCVNCFTNRLAFKGGTWYVNPIIIYGTGSQEVNLLDQGFNVVTSPTNNGVLPYGFAVTIFPISGYFRVSQPLDICSFENLTGFDIYPGDVYQYNAIRFGRKATHVQPRENGLIIQNQSTGGQTETLFNAYKPRHTFGVQVLEGMGIKGKLNNFYNSCVKGNPFAVMVDDTNYGFGVLAQDTNVGDQSVTLKSISSCDPTDGFSPGRIYRLFDSAMTKRQKVTLQSDTNVSLTFVENLDQEFKTLDFICDDENFPFLELGQNPEGVMMTNDAYLRFDWNQNCQEWTGED